MRFLGRVQVEGSGSGWLRAEVRVERHRLVLLSGGEELGSWPISAVAAHREEGDRFELLLGADRVTFAADDALAFSYDALPVLSKSGGLGSVMSSLRSVLSSREREEGDDSNSTVATVAAVDDDSYVAEGELPEGNRSRLRELVEAARRPALINDDLNDDSQLELEYSNLDLDHVEETEDLEQPQPSWLPPVSTVPGLKSGGGGSWLSSVSATAPPVTDPVSPHQLAAVEEEEEVASDNAALNKLYRRLEQAIDDVGAGNLSPPKASAIAELAKAMCFAVYAGGDERVEELAERLIEAR